MALTPQAAASQALLAQSGTGKITSLAQALLTELSALRMRWDSEVVADGVQPASAASLALARAMATDQGTVLAVQALVTELAALRDQWPQGAAESLLPVLDLVYAAISHTHPASDIVSGILPVARGGTGAATLGDAGVLVGNGTGAIQVVAAGTAGQLLTSNGAGVDPSMQTLVVPPGYTDEEAQDAVGAMVDTTLVYTDSTPQLSRAALTGDVTASAGSNATTIAAQAVGVAKMTATQTDVFFGRDTAGAGAGEEITVAAAKTLLNLAGSNTGDQTITLTGDVTGSGTGSFAATIANDAVTYAKMQSVSAASKLLGRGDSGSGDPQEITLGTNLSMSGTTLNASGGGGSATVVEKDLGTPAWRGSFTITDAGISAASKVLCWQAPGPYTGKGTRADEAEMQPVNVIYVEPGSGVCTVKWETPPMITSCLTVNDIPKRNIVGGTYDRLANQLWPMRYEPKRIGKIRGNVKFCYQILS